MNGIADTENYYRIAVKYTLSDAKPDSDLRDRFAAQAKMADQVRDLETAMDASVKQSPQEAEAYRKTHPDENFAVAQANFDARDQEFE